MSALQTQNTTQTLSHQLRLTAAAKGLGRAEQAGGPEHERQAATQLVSELFFKPMLAELRNQSFGGSIGSGGRGEEVFGAQLDELLADRAAASGVNGLVDHIAALLRGRRHDAVEQRDSSTKHNSAPATPDLRDALAQQARLRMNAAQLSKKP